MHHLLSTRMRNWPCPCANVAFLAGGHNAVFAEVQGAESFVCHLKKRINLKLYFEISVADFLADERLNHRDLLNARTLWGAEQLIGCAFASPKCAVHRVGSIG
jgi:hypothetical protein